MAAVKSHIRLLRGMGACSEAVIFAEQFPSLKAAWKACPRGDWMLWLIPKWGEPVWGTPEHRKIAGIACRCARLAEKRWADAQSRDAVALALAERYAAGEEISQAALRTAAWAAWAAWAAGVAGAAWAAGIAWAAGVRTAMQKQCADIVREAYPVPPAKKEEP